MSDHQLHVDDDGFVRAPVAEVYPVLTNLELWASWWPGTRLATTGDDRHRVVLGRGPLRTRLTIQAHGWRHDAGFRLRIAGALQGDAEFWLEEGWGGTVVHHLATLSGSRRGLERYRRWVRHGLWGVKDHVQHTVLEAGPA